MRMMTDKKQQLKADTPAGSNNDDPFYKLRGLLKKEFELLGGGEAFLKAERNHFYDDDESREEPCSNKPDVEG